jgi:predicted AAA+ superfamily ATPase
MAIRSARAIADYQRFEAKIEELRNDMIKQGGVPVSLRRELYVRYSLFSPLIILIFQRVIRQRPESRRRPAASRFGLQLR